VIKTLSKWAFRLFIVLIVLAVAAILLMDTAIKALAERRIKDQTGLDVKIGKFEVSFLNRRLLIENLVLYNNADFGGSVMINLPELLLECDPEAMQARKLRFKLARINLSELNMVYNAAAKNNFYELMAQMEARQKKAEAAGKKTIDLDTDLEFDGIDTLNLTLGKVRTTDLKNPANSKEYEIGIKNEVITGLKTQEDVQNKFIQLLFRAATLPEQPLTGGVTPAPPTAQAPPTPAPVPQVVR
jgi:hypothetical protein